MSPQEIIDAYNVLSQDVKNNAAQEAARVGNAQRSIGVMAERVANPSGQTSGLANYTYNRTMRPAVETNAAALVTQGKAQAMQKYLSDELMKAKNAYEDAKNKYQVSSSAASADSMKAQQRQVNYVSDSQYTGKETPENKQTSSNDKKGGGLPDVPDQVINSAISNANAYASLTGGGQMQEIPMGTKFSYTLNGQRHEGVVYAGQGGEIDGVSFTKSGLKNYLDQQVRNGASFQNYLGNDTNYSLWKIAFKIN